MSDLLERIDKHLNEAVVAEFKAFAKKFGVDLKDDLMDLNKSLIGKWKAHKEVKGLLAQGYKIQSAAQGRKGNDQVVKMVDKSGNKKFVHIPV